jgi:hypothetical protein
VARLARRAAVALAILLLAFAFVQQAVVSHAIVLDEEPALALGWAPNNPDILAGAAADRAVYAKTDADFRDVDQLARRALQRSPLEPGALRALSWEADHQGRKADALAIMTLAGRLTQRDNYIHGTLYWDAVARRDWPAAFLNVDPILRRVPDLGPAFFPTMIDALSDPGARQAAVSRLVWRPEWRGPFLAALANDPKNAGEARLVFEALYSSRAPLSESEQSLLIDDLVGTGAYADARAEWLRLLPASDRSGDTLLYDGGFKGLPGTPPFNWSFVDEDGAVSELGDAPGGGPALHLEYPTGRPHRLLAQTLVLPPGSYRLRGQVLFDQSARGDQLAWRLECVGGEKLAEQRQAASGAGWSQLQIDFATPPTGCAAQRLELSSLAQDDIRTSEAWVRNLALSPGQVAGATAVN